VPLEPGGPPSCSTLLFPDGYCTGIHFMRLYSSWIAGILTALSTTASGFEPPTAQPIPLHQASSPAPTESLNTGDVLTIPQHGVPLVNGQVVVGLSSDVSGENSIIVDEAVSGETIVNGPVIESSAARYYRLGEQELNSKRRESAIAYFTESLRLDPRNPIAYYKRGIEYAQSSAAAPPEGPSQDQQRALGDFTEALLRCNRWPNLNTLSTYIYISIK